MTDQAQQAQALPAQRRQAAPGEPAIALELLVHGVGGTTPEAMLTDPHLVQLTGDTVAGTYRRWSDRHAEEEPDRYRGGAVEEAYSWAGLTSGSSMRALWLLLLPFMFANLAHWMRPPAPRTARAQGLYDMAVRLSAVSLTVLLTAAACETALDLTAWQCAGTAGCAAHHSWLGFLSAAHGGWWSQPGRRLALASAVPGGLVAVLWWLSHLTWTSYESQRPAAAGKREDLAPMEMPGFWYGMRLVRRLRMTHVAAGLLTADLALLLPVLDYDRSTGGPLAVPGWILLALLALLAGGVVTALVTSSRSESEQDDRPDDLAMRALHWASLALLGLTVLYAAWARHGWHSAGRLPGAAGLFAVLCLVQLALVLVLVLAVRLLKGKQQPLPEQRQDITVPGPFRPVPDGDVRFGGPDGPALRGFAGPATAMLGAGLGNLLTAGATVWAAQWLMGKGTLGVTVPGPPLLLVWHSSGVPLLAVLLLPLLATLGVRMVRQKAALKAQVNAAYDVEGDAAATRTTQIAGALAKARLTDAGPVLIGTLAALAFALAAGSVAGALATGRTPSLAAHGDPTVISYAATTLQSVGGWLVGAFVLMLVAVGRAAYKQITTRRTVGVFWDIGTFWPRAAHPFAPPCYAERAVPDLDWRIRTWLDDDPTRRLVVSGHSQGTVLAAAAVWQLDPETRARVALLTYGCPLHRLYSRFFPGFTGPEDLSRLHADAPYWRNLFRITDPIGGPVRVAVPEGAQPVDAPPFVDPLVFDRDQQHPLPVPINAHSDYRADPRFIQERDALLTQL
ncbi:MULTISPECIES: hypothetical protein [Streptacidiphilus]|uniref:Lipase family protein n=1 Tax=Streptacidiphilus cavernicola TaxID=3342716 RepID=A0ABV6UY60_9ACTN|nr:hypothetical protein [Streptacidiphilus jeojiense]